MTNENLDNVSHQQKDMNNRLMILDEKIKKEELKAKRATENLKRLKAEKKEIVKDEKVELITQLIETNKINKDILTDSQKRILGL